LNLNPQEKNVSDYKQNAVSEKVWPWVNPQVKNHDPRPTLVVAIVTMLVAWCIAGAIYYFGHRAGVPEDGLVHEASKKPTIMAGIVVSISIIIFLLSVFSPKGYGAFHKAMMKFTGFVNIILTKVMLVPFYYLVFPIGRMSQKLKGNDPMQRKFPTDEASYWEKRAKVEDLESYRRQH
jgi:hypothetical protein